MATTVTNKGHQVTIPKPVRDRLGIVPGSRVEFRLAADGSTVIEKADGTREPGRFARLVGIAGPGLSTDEIMAITRGDWSVTLVGSNVLPDIFGQTPNWWEWSLAQLESAAARGPLLINDVILAETSIRFPMIEISKPL